MVCPERILAMKLGFALLIVGSAVSGGHIARISAVSPVTEVQ
jgi:hypothetical protein